MRAHSEKELFDKLCVRHEPEAAAQAVASLRETGGLDDVSFAEGRVHTLLQKNKSTLDIRRKMKELGVEQEIVQAALEAAEASDAEAAKAVVQRHYMAKLAAGKRENVMAALARRGFKHRDIVYAVNAAQEDNF